MKKLMIICVALLVAACNQNAQRGATNTDGNQLEAADAALKGSLAAQAQVEGTSGAAQAAKNGVCCDLDNAESTQNGASCDQDGAAETETTAWKQAESFAAAGTKTAPGVREFGLAFAKAHESLTLVADLGQSLELKKAIPETTLTIDERNGYLSFGHPDAMFFRTIEMCVWKLQNGTRRYAVRIEDDDEDSMPRVDIWFFDYDAAANLFRAVDVPGSAEMRANLDVYDGNENLYLPRRGKDIRWGRNNGGDPLGWYRFQPDGSFVLERVPQKDTDW